MATRGRSKAVRERAPAAAPATSVSYAEIARQAESYGPSATARDQALADFCQVLLCSNEFIYVD